MSDIITQTLGSRYCMFYQAAVPSNQLVPGQRLDQALEHANHLLASHGFDLEVWDQRYHDAIARIMYVHWIAARLTQEPVRKPLLVHYNQGRLHVDCGDTRLMAMQAANNQAPVSAVLTTTHANAHLFDHWHRVLDSKHLLRLAGFDPDIGLVLVSPVEGNLDWCIDWLELGDQSTTHHLHDVSFRLKILKNYLQTQDKDFQFSKSWFSKAIDWSQYQ